MDMMLEKCLKCEDGHYRETNIHDDWEGVLHCNKCGDETKRWRRKPIRKEHETI